MMIAATPRTNSRVCITQHRAVGPRAALAGSAVGATSPSSHKCSTIALKEWAVGIAALHAGDQTVLLRKGGIKEPVFRPQSSSFLLFPTSFHSDQQLLKPGIAERFADALAMEPKALPSLPVTTYVTITGAWVTADVRVLAALDDQHVWTQAFVDARLKWRGKQPLTILELRAWQLDPPAQLSLRDEFWGCFSFVDLAAGLEGGPPSLATARPALPDDEFAARQHTLRDRLATIDCTELRI